MKPQAIVIAVAVASAIGAGGYATYRLGIDRGIQMIGINAATPIGDTKPTSAQIDPATGKKILYWHDPMVPGQKFNKPGKSPFMDMQLVPVYAEGDGDASTVAISPRVQQNLGVRTAEVTKGALTQALDAVGSVAYNDRDVAVVTARTGGYVERLYVRAPLDPVHKGQPLAELYVPDWIAAQEEYLSVRRMQGQGTETLVAAARQRMLLVGMDENQVRSIESGGKVQPRFTLTAPINGVIAELGAREGSTVPAGTMLFRINGLGSVWVYADIPESRAAMVRVGALAEARTSALPERVYKGRVAAILPEVTAATRTLKARVEIVNAGGLLVPGMFATISFAPRAAADVLLVPSEAVIQTGQRKVAILALEGGKFLPVDVETGTEANGQIEIRKGLATGQKVVVSSQFLIDSEASLKATTTRMSEAPPATEAQASKIHRGTGKVEAVSQDAVTLSHAPIPSLQWGAMTMDFKLPAAGLPKAIGKGDLVNFEFTQDKDGQAVLTTITPATPDKLRTAK